MAGFRLLGFSNNLLTHNLLTYNLIRMVQPQKRNPAYKVRIADILKAEFVKNENEPNYLVIAGKNVYRVNLLGTIVIKNMAIDSNYNDIMIDDGSEKILLRSFENPQILDNFSIGDLLLVIGKPREYGKERYILPEIIKKIDDVTWIKVRGHELKKSSIGMDQATQTEEAIIESKTRYGMIAKTIEEFDKGDGADIDSVINSLNVQDADKIIFELIKDGVVYEVKAGRIRLL